jgi:hypothetical protein
MKHILLLTFLFLPKLVFGIEICEDKAAIDLEDIREIQENGNILKYSYTYKNKIAYYALNISDAAKHHLRHANLNNYIYIGEKDENGDYVFSIDCTPKITIPHKKHKFVPNNNNRIMCTEKSFFRLVPIFNIYGLLLDKIKILKKLPIHTLKVIRQESMKNHIDTGEKFTIEYFVTLHLLSKKDLTAKSALEENNFFANNNPDYIFGNNINDNTNIRYLLKRYSYKK